MATTLTITGAGLVADGYEVRYTLNGVAGRGMVLGATLAAVQQWVDDHAFTDDDLIELALRIWKANSPGLVLAAIVGKTMTIDLTNLAAVVKVV